MLVASADRSAAGLAAWSALVKAQGIANVSAPVFDPVTGAIKTLSSVPAGSTLYLPKVGTGLPMSEEETRESLRRFIINQSRLIGAEPQQLSLISRTDAPDGAKTARYEQRPFRLPLRGGYGKLQIDFTPDGRLLKLSSTCIPEAENLLRTATAAGIRPRYTADEVAKHLVGRSFTTASLNANGNVNQTSAQAQATITASDKINVRELIVYPQLRATEPAALEFHLAWELTITHAAETFTVYLDAVTDEFLSATRTL
jgi:hypothetical protein